MKINLSSNSPCYAPQRSVWRFHGMGEVFTLRAFESKFGAFVTEFENGWIQWNSGRVEGKMGRENILLVKVG